jgi:hypothetical protein
VWTIDRTVTGCCLLKCAACCATLCHSLCSLDLCRSERAWQQRTVGMTSVPRPLLSYCCPGTVSATVSLTCILFRSPACCTSSTPPPHDSRRDSIAWACPAAAGYCGHVCLPTPWGISSACAVAVVASCRSGLWLGATLCRLVAFYMIDWLYKSVGACRWCLVCLLLCVAMTMLDWSVLWSGPLASTLFARFTLMLGWQGVCMHVVCLDEFVQGLCCRGVFLVVYTQQGVQRVLLCMSSRLCSSEAEVGATENDDLCLVCGAWGDSRTVIKGSCCWALCLYCCLCGGMHTYMPRMAVWCCGQWCLGFHGSRLVRKFGWQAPTWLRSMAVA